VSRIGILWLFKEMLGLEKQFKEGVARQGNARLDKASQGKARQGKSRQGRLGNSRLGVARQVKEYLGKAKRG
jgi:hypothetical protein